MRHIPLLKGLLYDHRIVTAKIHLNLRRYTAQTTKTTQYDWSLHNNRDIRNKYTITQRNKFDVLQEISEILTLNVEYVNFVNVHMEAAAKCIPTKGSNIELHRRHYQLGKNETTWKHYPNEIKVTQLVPMLRNLRRHKEN